MARQVGPDTRSFFYTAGPKKGTGFYGPGTQAPLYADEACTLPADVRWPDGTAIPVLPGTDIPVIRIADTYELPDILFPDVDDPVIYTRVGGGPVVPLRPTTDDRLDRLDAAVRAAREAAEAAQGMAAAAETPAGAQAKVTAEATARTNADALLTPKTDPRLSDARTPTAHAASHGSGGSDSITVAQAQVSGLASTLASKADLVGGFIPSAQIPAVALTAFLGAVGSQAAMLALVGQPGDWATRTDTGTTWQITGNAPAQLSSWTQLLTPADAVSSVNGQIGPVTLTKSDVGLSNVDNTSDATKPLSAAVTNALVGKRDVPANYIDPAAYGLVPSATVDRTTAFQNMLNAIPAAGGNETGGAYIELPKGIFLLNNPTSGVLLKMTNKPNVTIRGAGSGTILRVSTAVATELLRLETCTNFKLENILLQVIGTAKVGKAIHLTTETDVGSAHLTRFTNVAVSCNGSYRRVWDFMTTSGSPAVYSAMAAFAAGDVGGNLMINLTGGAWQAAITAVATLSATLAADINTTATTVTLNAALPGAPANGFTVQVETERMYVTAGGNTTTLTVTRGRGVDGIRTAHTTGATVVTYSATVDSNAPSSSSTASAPGRIQPTGTARLDVGLAIGTDHPGSPDLDVANTYLTGFSASRCHVAGVQVGNGTTADILDHWMHGSTIAECGYGVYLTAGSLTVNDCDFSTNIIDYRRFGVVSQECKIDGVRTEGPGLFYEITGAGTSGPMSRLSSVQVQTFNAEDGVPIRHLNSAALLLENVDLTSSRQFAGNVQVVAAGTSSFPCHLVAINVSSSGGNTDLFSAVTLPTAYKSIISQPRTNIAGAVLANSTQGWETNLRVRFTGGLIRGRTPVADVNYTVLNSDMVVAYTSLSAARVVTLPAQAASLPAAQEFTIKDESGACDGTKTITIIPPAGTIDGAASLVLNSAYARASVYTNGANWFSR